MNNDKDKTYNDLLIYEDKLKEECGVFGVFSEDSIDICTIMYYGLCALQHRGQESAGIAVCNGQKIACYKDMGLVSEVFNKCNLDYIKGKAAIGHVRYSTTGDSSIVNAQPILERCNQKDISIAHNGNLSNTKVLKRYLNKSGISLKTTTDSEIILKLIIRQLNEAIQINKFSWILSGEKTNHNFSISDEASKNIYEAIARAVNPIEGAYSFLLLTTDSLIGVRDPYGIRPLCIGKLDDSYIICSESCALSAVGATFIRNVEPGEIVIINKLGINSTKFSKGTNLKTCAFEYIYFSREDSIIDGVNVYNSRIYAGMKLYEQSPASADVIIGVPESGIAAALGYSKASGIPYEMGFVKNKYIGRSFIQPNSKIREEVISIKLNILKEAVKDKRVVVVDDSIVRGTTIKKIIQSLKNNGAREVHLRIASPPIKYCCSLGIDTTIQKELIASDKTEDQIKDIIDADSLSYLNIENLLISLGNKDNFCLGCFKGQYPIKYSKAYR